MPNLIVLFGPPAVGKAAVGHELSRLLGYRFFHNHLTADPAAALFGWGGAQFGRMVRATREILLKEASADKSIPGVIFTYVWDLEDPDKTATMSAYASLFEMAGGKAFFVELIAPLETRLEREGTPFRLNLKPAQRDVGAARARQKEMAARYKMNTEGAPPIEYPFIAVDTLDHQPKAAAELVIRKFSLAVTRGDA